MLASRGERASNIVSNIIMTANQQFWLEFLDVYKMNTCLWDIHSGTYMRRDLRNAAYDVLLEKYKEIEPNATLDMVKKKIDIFRTGYRRELRKINETRETSSCEMEYKPTLWYFNKLSFLDFHDEASVKESNESDDQAEAAIEYIDIPDDYVPPNPVVKYRLKKRKLNSKTRPRVQPQESPASVSSLSFETDEDDCATYCASLKLQMRELDTQQKFIAQKLISDVIFLARTSQLTLESCINSQPF